MRFYSRKAPQKKTDVLIEKVSTGKCDDLVISELRVAASESTDPAEMEHVITSLLDIALKSTSMLSVAYAMRALMAFRPLTAGLEDDMERRMAELANDKAAMATRPLQEAMADLLYIRVSERADCAQPFMGTLVQFLDERSGRVGTVAYNTLVIVAANRPEFFEGQTTSLIRMLGSINNVTRIETSRIIAVLAMSHPEYVASAEKTLLHLSSFNPDADVKSAASEAHQILSGRLKANETARVVAPVHRSYEEENTGGFAEIMRRKAGIAPVTPVSSNEEENTGGFAEIMRRKAGKEKKVQAEGRIDRRLLSLATNFARKGDRAYKIDGESPAEFEEKENEAMSRAIDDFSEIAESIKAEAGPSDTLAPAAAEAAVADGGDTTEEAELRLMMEKVEDDFSITAGSILDAIGMGHLAKKPVTGDAKSGNAADDRPKRGRLVRPDLARNTRFIAPRPPVKNEAPAEEPEISPKEFIASIESIISNIDNMPAAQPAAQAPAPAPASGPAIPVKTEAEIPAAPIEAPTVPAPEAESTTPATDAAALQSEEIPVETARAEKPAVTRPEEPEKRVRAPIVPPSVRISAMKFKSSDPAKARKPAPAKISIKPHIKPLSKPPVDPAKNPVPAPVQYPMAGAPEIKTDGSSGYVICHSCNAKMPDDSQRCAVCGSDLKEPKTRCHKCGEIVPIQAGKCTRCGSGLNE